MGESAINSSASIKKTIFFPFISSNILLISKFQISSKCFDSTNLSARAYKTISSFSTIFLHNADFPLPSLPCMEINFLFSDFILDTMSFLSISYSLLIKVSIFFNPTFLEFSISLISFDAFSLNFSNSFFINI